MVINHERRQPDCIRLKLSIRDMTRRQDPVDIYQYANDL